MLSKAHLTSHSRISGSRWVITPSWLSWSWRSFLYSSSVCSCHLFLISSASVRSIPFLSFIEPIFAWNVRELFFIRALIPPMRTLPSWLNHPSNTPHTKTVTRFQHMNRSNHSSNLITICHISVFIENLSVPSHFNIRSCCPVAKFGSDSATPRTAKYQASLSFTISWSFLKLMPIESVMPSNSLILCCPLLLPSSIFSNIRGFSTESALPIRWPKYWSFSFNISPSNEYPRSISFQIDWFDLLAAQETHKSLLQHHSEKASILWHSASFIVQLSQLYMTTGKTIALTLRILSVKQYLHFVTYCLGLS